MFFPVPDRQEKTDVEKALLKLQAEYSDRGINLICISKKWSFRTV